MLNEETGARKYGSHHFLDKDVFQSWARKESLQSRVVEIGTSMQSCGVGIARFLKAI